MATSPAKPWEQAGVNYNSLNYPTSVSVKSSGNQFVNDLSNVGVTAVPMDHNENLNPPPLPPRPNLTISPYMNNNSFSPMYRGYGSYSMYNNPYGYGMNQYGYSNYNNNYVGTPNSFVQMAEENSRPAFQSIEAIVHAIGSVSMMLESTYNALYSSFRAVLGVAHHFSHMKTQITDVLSALAIFRSLRWLFRKVLYLLGLRSTNPLDEDVWSNVSKAMNSANLNDPNIDPKRSCWPIVMFFAVVFGGPWLIWKLLMSMAGKNETNASKWMTGEGPYYTAVAAHNFRGENSNELSFVTGQTIRVAPKELQPRVRGWLLATVDGKTSGLIPANYIRLIKPNTMQTQANKNVPLNPIKESVTNIDENLVTVQKDSPDL